MKRKLINKIILGTMISVTMFSLTPTKASAGWANDYQGNLYYMQGNSKATGWKKIDGQLYYFDENGKMQKGWIKAGSSWYFLQNNGALKTGWINYNKNWYYADSTGEIQTGVISIDGKVYMFDDSGIMKTSNTVINGTFYTIGTDGEVVGSKLPTPDKELDSSGECIKVLNNNNSKIVASPTSVKYNEVIEDKTESNDDPKEGRKFTITLKDSNGVTLESKTVKYKKSVDLSDFSDEPTKSGYVFKGWNTKSNGSGKSYDKDDDIKVTEDITLYAQYSTDTTVYVSDIKIKGNSYVTVNKTIQMAAEVSPSNAGSKSVSWSVANGTGTATIDGNGVLTGVTAGTVTVKATASDGSNVSDTKIVNVSATDVTIPVTKVTVASKTGASTITTDGGTLQMAASILPDDANTQDVTWTVENNTGSASYVNNGDGTITLTAISNGTVTVKATASGVVGSTTITLSGQTTKIPVTGVSIGAKNVASTDPLKINTDGGTLQLIANILPTIASNKGVQWSIVSGSDVASLSTSGLLTALKDGTITVKVTALDVSGGKPITDTKVITVSNQSTKVAKITITGAFSITGSAAQSMKATVEGANSATPTKTALKWTIQNKTGSASINQTTGVLTPVSNGIVTVTATATDGSGVSDSKDVTISGVNSAIPITSITVAESNGNTYPSITKDDGTLDLVATILPSYASTTSGAVTWSISSRSGGGTAKILTTTGNDVKIQALTNGIVTVKATVKDIDGSTKTGSVDVSIDNQIQQVQKIEINPPFNSGKVGKNEGLLLTAKVTGGDSQYQKVKWQVSNLAGDTGSATFDSNINGLLKGGLTPGKVTVTAISTDGYNTESAPITIEVVDPIVKASTITVTGPQDSSNNEITKIETNKGTLKMSAAVDSGASSNVVTWSVSDPTKAKIVDNGDSTATITAVENGTVDVIATGSGGKTGFKTITITNQEPTSLTLTSAGGATSINTIGATLDVLCNLVPNTATTPASVVWSVSDTSKATIESNDKTKVTLKAIDNGIVTVTVTATTAAGTKLTASTPITINAPKSVTISKGSSIISGGSSITVSNGATVTLTGAVLPSTVTTKGVNWTVTGSASYVDNGDGTITLTATSSGTVTVKAIAKGDSNVSASTTITIS